MFLEKLFKAIGRMITVAFTFGIRNLYYKIFISFIMMIIYSYLFIAIAFGWYLANYDPKITEQFATPLRAFITILSFPFIDSTMRKVINIEFIIVFASILFIIVLIFLRRQYLSYILKKFINMNWNTSCYVNIEQLNDNNFIEVVKNDHGSSLKLHQSFSYPNLSYPDKLMFYFIDNDLQKKTVIILYDPFIFDYINLKVLYDEERERFYVIGNINDMINKPLDKGIKPISSNSNINYSEEKLKDIVKIVDLSWFFTPTDADQWPPNQHWTNIEARELSITNHFDKYKAK